jgi:hypothetical protein
MHVRTRYIELVFLHLVGSTGHVVHFGTSGARNVDALFFMLRWAGAVLHKKRDGTRYAKLVFLHPVGSWVTYCILMRLGREMSTHYFSCFGGPGAVSIKSILGHVTPNLYFCIL